MYDMTGCYFELEKYYNKSRHDKCRSKNVGHTYLMTYKRADMIVSFPMAHEIYLTSE